ncbi:MAG: hypothetical protein J2P46_10235 [Zavarzinella sp.]|nr:hypothetical protein [Zavarzinella sp.]
MKRRRIGVAAAAVAVVVLAALYAQKKPADNLLVLDWAAKASLERPPAAVLIEFGHKDTAPTDWSGQVEAAGARIVHREGYRFRPKLGDELTDAGWKAGTRRPIRVPPKQPAVAKIEGIGTVGVVLHLSDVQNDAKLTVNLTGQHKAKVEVPLKEVLAGKPLPILDGQGVVRLVSTALPVVMEKTEDDFPAACYGPDGTLWVAWVGYHLKDEARRVEAASLKQQPENFRAYDTPELGDQVFAKAYKDGRWGQPIAITGPNEDIIRCAIAADGGGNVVVSYSALRNGARDIFARSIDPAAGKPGKEQKLTGAGRDERAEHLAPAMATDGSGQVHLVHSYRAHDGTTGVAHEAGLRIRDDGWSAGSSSSSGRGGGAVWTHTIAAGPGGVWQTACDSYARGDYDVELPFRGTPNTAEGGRQEPVASSSRFEARPSIAYDPAGRLWIAYEEGPELWGKDYGALAADKGQPLYSSRSVRVVCLDGGKLMRPAAELPTSEITPPKAPSPGTQNQNVLYEKAPRFAYPQIGIDGKGRVWLTYRQKFGTRYSSVPGSYWLTFARRLDGDHWTEPIELHHSCGLLDHRPVLLPHKSGGLLIIHNTDGRYTTPEHVDNDIYLSYLDLPGDPVEPKLVPHEAGAKKPELVEQTKREATSVQRIRDYRVESDGKNYRLLRGEFHRHTEISWDGGPDGSLEDMFRYAIDTADMDWIGNGDHDNGAGREYTWWLVQKFTDAYTVPARFTGMFTYERSVAYPQGHRNCVFARRGIRTLPRLADPDSKQPNGIHADDTKMLYRYLKELGGICASHTSATNMGTDWRDNDPKVEPLVEIYQGDRMSYEKEGAPRAGYDPKGDKEPHNIAGWFPKGFVDHALGEKGYRLGFESSSDHWSTHISYCIVLAEKNDRESILEGMRKRHAYGATDDIICDVRSGPHVMGDEFDAMAAPRLAVKVTGTGDLAKVEVLRDSSPVAELPVKGRECSTEWTDPDPKAGLHYYYIRVQQKDGELAWTSPMWVNRRE